MYPGIPFEAIFFPALADDQNSSNGSIESRRMSVESSNGSAK
jgi:hypothetical protein